MNSFAVLSLVERDSTTHEFMDRFLRSAACHGMKLPDIQKREALSELICYARAKSVEDVSGFFCVICRKENVNANSKHLCMDNRLNVGSVKP